MVKRITAMLMAVMLVWTMVPFEAAADASGTEVVSKDGTYSYKVSDDRNDIEITAYNGNVAILTIPTQIDDYPVTGIGKGAFQGNDKLQSVIIQENSVKSIGENAFAGCTNLQSVTISNSVTSIGTRAFMGCTGLQSVVIPNSVTALGNNAFENCTDLQSVSLSNSLTAIEARTFKQCENLQSVTIPDSVTSIGDAAFSYCTALQEVRLSNSLTTLGDKLFYKDSALETIEIPEGVEEIPNGIFYDCTKLSSIKIPLSVKSIGDNAFNGITSLTIDYAGTQSDWTKVTIGKNNYILPNASATINYNGGTAAQTEKPTEATTTKSIADCTITVAETATYTGAEIKPEVTVKSGTTTLVKDTDYTVEYKNNIAISTSASPATVTITGKGNYTGAVTKNFTITAEKTSLEKAVITLEYTTVSYDGKAKEPAVKSVVLGTTTLKATSDYQVTYKDNTNIGTATVTVTGAGTYTGTATTTFKIEAASLEKAAATLETRSYKYDGTAKQPKVTSVKLNTTVLKENTDYTVSYKDNTQIGTAVVTITGKGNYTGTLTRIFLILPENTSIENAGVTLSKTTYTYDGKAKKPTVQSVKLGDTVLKSETDYTVSYKNNKNIGTASVVVTGKGDYNGTVTQTFEIKAKTGKVFTRGSGKYKVLDADTVSFTGLAKSTTKKLTIPETVKYGGKNFTVTAVAAKALKGTKITSAVVGNTVSAIGKSAFEGCTALKTIRIGTGVTEIGTKACKGCKKLATITIESTLLESVGTNAFSGIKSNARIKVPEGMLEAYTELLQDKGQGSKVTIK